MFVQLKWFYPAENLIESPPGTYGENLMFETHIFSWMPGLQADRADGGMWSGPHRPVGGLSLVFIANTMDLRERGLLPRVLSRL